MKLAIYPCFPKFMKGKQLGFSAGWYNEEENYCVVFANFKTRETANEVLQKEKPGVGIVNLDSPAFDRRNPGPYSYEKSY